MTSRDLCLAVFVFVTLLSAPTRGEEKELLATVISSTDGATHDAALVGIGSRLTFAQRKYFEAGANELGIRATKTDPTGKDFDRLYLTAIHGKTVQKVIALGQEPDTRADFFWNIRMETKRERGWSNVETNVYNQLRDQVAAAKAKRADLPVLLPPKQSKAEMNMFGSSDQKRFTLWGKCIDADGKWHDFQVRGPIATLKGDDFQFDLEPLEK